MKLGRWSTTAASNNTTPPDGWPEGQAPSTVNDCAREMMASIRTVFEDPQYFDQDYTPTFITTTSFSVPGDKTSAIHTGRRLKIYDATAGVATTIYATVVTSSLSGGATQIALSLDAGNLTTSLTSFAISILSNNNSALPRGHGDRISASAIETNTLTVSGVAVFIGAATFSSSVAVAGAFAVSGQATMLSGMTINGAVVMYSSLTVSGAVTLRSTLSVSGETVLTTATIAGTLTVSGATTLKNTLTVGGAAAFGSTLTASGAVTMNTTLSVSGDLVAKTTLFVRDTTLGFYSPSTNILGVITNGTERWRFDSAGRILAAGNNQYDIGMTAAGALSSAPRTIYTNALQVEGATKVGTTLTVSGAVSVLAGQISFPATQNPSADANTLDDYEEGTFTPKIMFGGLSTTAVYSSQVGTYTKIGNIVKYGIFLTLSGKGTTTGSLRFEGLPFTVGVANTPATFYATNLVSLTGALVGYANSGTDRIQVSDPGTGTPAAITDANVTNSATFMIAGFYFV